MPRLVPAPISLVFSEADLDIELFKREYQQLSESDDNPINQWLKLAKARGDTAETDPVLLNLVVELHNKIDALERFLKDEEPNRVSLLHEAHIESIGFEHFKPVNTVYCVKHHISIFTQVGKLLLMPLVTLSKCCFCSRQAQYSNPRYDARCGIGKCLTQLAIRDDGKRRSQTSNIKCFTGSH